MIELCLRIGNNKVKISSIKFNYMDKKIKRSEDSNCNYVLLFLL